LLNRDKYFIIYFYGGKIDALLLLTSLISKKIILDIHDIYALDACKIGKYKHIIDYFISKHINHLIVHSERNKQILKEINYQKETLEIPHFKYNIAKIAHGNISKDLEDSIEINKLNVLFFGNMRLSKGIDILLETLEDIQFNEKYNSSLNFIIAGKDTIGIKERFGSLNHKMTKLILRHIDDNELSYLFKKSNYLILPYREISQSGVLEMAIGYKKPVLLSDIDYFIKYIEKYSSFGLLFKNSKEGLKKCFNEIIDTNIVNPSFFYNDLDCKKYLNYDENSLFVDKIIEIIDK
jgi:hypothetical protein